MKINSERKQAEARGVFASFQKFKNNTPCVAVVRPTEAMDLFRLRSLARLGAANWGPIVYDSREHARPGQPLQAVQAFQLPVVVNRYNNAYATMARRLISEGKGRVRILTRGARLPP